MISTQAAIEADKASDKRKEKTKLAEKNLMNDQELESVSGGEWRIVNTGDSRDAAIRSYPGVNAPVVATLHNGTEANATNQFAQADGRNWVYITAPVQGWIKGAILGYAY